MLQNDDFPHFLSYHVHFRNSKSDDDWEKMANRRVVHRVVVLSLVLYAPPPKKKGLPAAQDDMEREVAQHLWVAEEELLLLHDFGKLIGGGGW